MSCRVRALNFLGAVATATLVTWPAAAYDDPAVAVCEFSWSHGEDLSREGIKRVGATISGDTVTITYERSVLNTKPQTTQVDCRFEADMQGRLSLRYDNSETVDACMKNPDLAEGVIKEFGRGSPEALALAKKIEDCQPVLKSALDTATDRLKNVQFPLLLSGIYPIKPADTELRVEVDRQKFETQCGVQQAQLIANDFSSNPESVLKADVMDCKEFGFLLP